MEELFVLMAPAFLTVLLLRLLLLPVKLGLKLVLNALCGLSCLWLINSAAMFTGIAIPVNAVTALTAGTLGIPGIALMALLAGMG